MKRLSDWQVNHDVNVTLFLRSACSVFFCGFYVDFTFCSGYIERASRSDHLLPSNESNLLGEMRSSV